MKNILQWLLHSLLYLVPVIAVIPMIASGFYPDIFASLSSTQVAGIVLGIGIGFVAYFDNKIEKLFKLKETFEVLPLSEALGKGIAINGKLAHHVKVFALTTEVIFPVFRDADCKIERCSIMLHNFSEDGPIDDAEQLNKYNDAIERKWTELHKSGKIEEIEFIRYDERPSEYHIIFDKSVLVSGFYRYNDTSPHGNDFEAPFIVYGKDRNTRKLIEKFSHKFDDWWSYWCENSLWKRGN